MCVCVPAKIVAITHAANRLALVDVGGARREVSIACIVDERHTVESCVGDWVLIHVGFAMSRIDEAEAAKTLQLLHELGAIEGELAQRHAELPGAAP
jgi:hydrogenase expression/formation protein HypC